MVVAFMKVNTGLINFPLLKKTLHCWILIMDIATCLSLACELIASLSVIFADEPTSGIT
jgi:hypothetical protein